MSRADDASDKKDLIDAINKLVSNIKSLDDKLVNFEKQRDSSISAIKTQFDKAVKDVDDAASKVDVNVKNSFCDAKASDLKTYDYNTAVKNAMASGQKDYDDAVKGVKDNDKSVLAILDSVLKETEACKDAACIGTQKASFDQINTQEGKRLDSDTTTATKAISTFQAIIDTSITPVTDNISGKESDAVTCFNKLVDGKKTIDQFTVNVNHLIATVTDDLTKQKDSAQVYVNAKISQLDASFKTIEDAKEQKIDQEKADAEKKKADVSTCGLDQVKTTLDAVRTSLVNLFKAYTLSYPANVKTVVDQTVSSISEQKKVSDNIVTQLKQCTTLDCISGISTVCTNKYGDVKKVVTEKKSQADEKIAGYNSNINITVETSTSTFNNKIDEQTTGFLSCIATQVNIAAIDSINTKAVMATNDIGVKITELELQAQNIKSKWLVALSTAIDNLEDHLFQIVDNVTTYENEANSHNVEITKCLVNETLLYKNVLRMLTEKTHNNIELHYSEVNTVKKHVVNLAQDCYPIAHSIIDLVRKCSIQDSTCIDGAQKQCDKNIGQLTTLETTFTDKLTTQIVKSDIAMKDDAAVIYREARQLGDATAEVIVKCIKKEIANSAIGFSPSLILLILGFLTQIYFNTV